MRYDFSIDYTIKISGKPDQIKDWIKEISLFMDIGISYMIMEKEIRNFDNLERIVEPVSFTLGDVHQIKFKSRHLMYSPDANGEEKKIHYNQFKALFDEARKKMDEKYKIHCKNHKDSDII